MEGSPGDSVLKNPPGKVGVTGDTGLIPGHRDTQTHTHACPLAPEELCILCRDEGCPLDREVTAAPQSALQIPVPFPWRWPGPSPWVTFTPVPQGWGIRPFNR